MRKYLARRREAKVVRAVAVARLINANIEAARAEVDDPEAFDAWVDGAVLARLNGRAIEMPAGGARKGAAS